MVTKKQKQTLHFINNYQNPQNSTTFPNATCGEWAISGGVFDGVSAGLRTG